MKITRIILTLSICLAFIAMFAGCSIFGADDGAIRGVVFYADDATPVSNPWVALYHAAIPDEIYILVQGDEQGRYNMFVPEGSYIALASPFETGPFTGSDTPFDVSDTVTTVKKITITGEAPE